MIEKNKWSRRQFSKAVISAQLLLASGILVLPSSCANDKKTTKEAPLNSSQQDILKAAMDELIPANHKMPSASDVGGVSYIIQILDELPDLIPLFQTLLDQLETKSIDYSDTGFVNLNNANRIQVLLRFEKDEPELFGTLKNFTYESYYTSPQVYELIGYEPHPTGTMGPKMEAFDESLLDRVKAMPPMYTKI